ncbi:MAG: S-methyl-5-thioribose-1-phosphate isomerase [Gammaproteobacteria bacterium]|nr:S-methyl-5-thioribose-1-phosphate isomerase [Gammaproteobacteria bacterium]MCW8927227.1 S-methyl-5-thioribose-1-phosphate isomerase [Gammaproteobacteria bacterium]MCW8973610.1 S-methyl-5-thioribose-1-phosphate isomerase [Gammaproteobacteria bacterium]MCW8993286.1 S-methyl-5-thioribose-1-phosphate isomerase [Gammaproteobacteria bacterium]
MSTAFDTIRAILWEEGKLKLLDQRLLPQQELYLEYEEPRAVADAIRKMVVRGAPAIGITAAYGVVLALKQRIAEGGSDMAAKLEQDLAYLADARPTAVNLAWALKRMGKVLFNLPEETQDPLAVMLAEARAIHEEDIAANRRMGELGAALITEAGYGVLTHCNTGSLATGGYGTALGVIRSAFAQQRISRVYADETRPWLQGARLTAWELVKDGIPVTLLADGAAAALMQQGRVKWVIVGSDRISANGDVANKIGTYSAAVAAKYHGVKVMVVAPTSTVDMSLASGDLIPIEQRGAEEVLSLGAQRVAAEGAEAWNPAFDVTPAELVDAIVTEKGVVLNPTAEKMAQMMEKS